MRSSASNPAVLLDLGTAVRDGIRARTAVLAACPGPPTAQDLVDAVTEPYRELLRRHRTRGIRWVKIVAQMSTQNHPALDATEHDLRSELLVQVRRAFPATDPLRLERRWSVALMVFLQGLSRAEEWNSRRGAVPSADDLAEYLDDQVTFLAGGLTALLG
ncbi:hypothetical protein ABIA39_000391 [Nocardia sp. GAS34]|uniref:TetR/AcrR family transcriptional regulator n=1 Tax=unclassified Nocardia TaxID=2637762 RepID=UPI003D20DCDC